MQFALPAREYLPHNSFKYKEKAIRQDPRKTAQDATYLLKRDTN